MIAKKKALFSQFLVQLTMFLVIPISVVFLNENERTVWLIFFTITTLNPILLLGFESTIFRLASYIAGGATTLQSEGLSKIDFNSNVDIGLFCTFTNSLKSIFFRLSIASTLIMYLAGNIYFELIKSNSILPHNVLPSWLIFSLAMLINNLGIYKDSVLRGFDRQEFVNTAYIFSRLTLLFLAVSSFFIFHDGLMNLVISYLFAIILLRFIINQQCI